MLEAKLTNVSLSGFAEWAHTMRNESKDKLVSFAMSLVLLVEMRHSRGGKIAASPFCDSYLQACQWWGEPPASDLEEIVGALGECWERGDDLLDWYSKTG